MSSIIVDEDYDRLPTPTFRTSQIGSWYSRKVESERMTFRSCFSVCFEAIKNFFLRLLQYFRSPSPSFQPLEHLKSEREDFYETEAPQEEKEVVPVELKIEIKIPEKLISETSALSYDKQLELNCAAFQNHLMQALQEPIKEAKTSNELQALRKFAQEMLSQFNLKLKTTVEENQNNLKNKKFVPLEIPFIGELQKFENWLKEMEPLLIKPFLNETDLELIKVKAQDFHAPYLQEKANGIQIEIGSKPTVFNICNKETSEFLKKLDYDIQNLINKKNEYLTFEAATQILNYGKEEIRLFNQKISSFSREFSLPNVGLLDPNTYFLDLEKLILVLRDVEALMTEIDLDKKTDLLVEIANQCPDSSSTPFHGLISVIERTLSLVFQTELGFINFYVESEHERYAKLYSAFLTISTKLGCKAPSFPEMNMETETDGARQEEENHEELQKTALAVEKTLRVAGRGAAVQQLEMSVQSLETLQAKKVVLWQIISKIDQQKRDIFIRDLSYILLI